MSAVRLMRRDGDDWVEQRVEKIDSPDIEQRLEKLIAPITDGGPVMLFLPREQILYTLVELDARADPQRQIEQAMEGRTPYTLEELSVDWELSENDAALVAAIARDTLDEAAAFAEVRHHRIAGYSTLFSGADFPRLPKFDGPSLDEPKLEVRPVAFTTARVPSRPPDAAVAAASAAASAKARFTPTPTAAERAAVDARKPVLDVTDATPVVQVKPPMVPLDPGIPISAPNAPPRIRTDIAAASVSGHAASLTPPGGSVRIRKARAPMTTLAVFAVAFLLTIGIAVLVWNMLPMRPGTTATAPLDTGAASRDIVNEATPADPLPPVETVEAEPPAATTEEAPLDGETTAPLTEITTADLAAPDSDGPLPPMPSAPSAPTPAFEVSSLATADVDTLPEADLTTPIFERPRMTAAMMTVAPFLGPDPDMDESSEDIFFSAFEIPDPATDAIALPRASAFAPGTPPNVTGEATAALPAESAADPVASAVAQALADALAGPGGLIPTDLARSLPSTAPRPRPEQFTQEIERQQFGGRTRVELARLRPPARPASEQSLAEASPEASELAVAASLTPRTRPENMTALVTAARVQAEAARVSASAALATPDTSGAIEAALEEDVEPEGRAERPRVLNIPTTASVARQATIEDAISLNRINLVGVYGAPSDRRALVRLSSGRYVKVKVGDRVDGGTVAQITDNELYYRKGNRTLSLQIPQG